MSKQEEPSFETVAKRLRDCAESLSSSAQRLQMTSGQQSKFVQKLNELNLRIKRMVTELQRADKTHRLAKKKHKAPPSDGSGKQTPEANSRPTGASKANFIDLADYLAKHKGGEYPKDAEHMTYIESMEFADVNEFLRFKNYPPISEDDIKNCDIDALFRRLLEG